MCSALGSCWSERLGGWVPAALVPDAGPGLRGPLQGGPLQALTGSAVREEGGPAECPAQSRTLSGCSRACFLCGTRCTGLGPSTFAELMEKAVFSKCKRASATVRHRVLRRRASRLTRWECRQGAVGPGTVRQVSEAGLPQALLRPMRARQAPWGGVRKTRGVCTRVPRWPRLSAL